MGREPIHIEVYTEDISTLTLKVSGYIQRLYSSISALAIRQQLYKADYNYLIQIANDTQKRGQPYHSDTLSSSLSYLRLTTSIFILKSICFT